MIKPNKQKTKTNSTMSYSTTTTTTTFLLATIFLIGLFEIKSIQSAKLQVPFQDLATPKPAISSKIYYLTESCSICEKFRPDFTRVKKPPGLNETLESEPSTEPKPDSDDGETLKRVPRQTSLATKLKGDDPDKDIILLDYRKQSLNDSDLQLNGTWSWKKSFKKIHAKWIERKNDTSKKIQQDVVAKLKIEKTPEGEEKKKLVLEFKKKIQNLTSLNSMMMIDEPYNAQEFEEEMLGDDEDNGDNEDGEKEKILVKREIKQIFLDPIKQPSIVIRSKRSTAIDTSNDPTGMNTDNPLIEMTTLPTQIFDENDQLLTNDNVTELKKNGTYEKCRLLIRLKANPEDIITDTAEEEVKEKELDSKVVTEDKKETSPEPNVADSVEKVDEIKSLEKITDNVVVGEQKEKEKQPEKLVETEEKSSNVLEEPKMIEKVATKIEETVSDMVSPSSPAPESTLTKEEEKSTNTVEELKPILTISDDEKLIAAATTTTKAETPIESSSPSSKEKVKEEVEAPKVTPKEVETPKIQPEEVETPMVKPEAIEAPKVTPKEVEAPKIEPEEVKTPEVTPKETSTISTVTVSTTEKPKPKPKSKPTNLQLGLLINIRKFVDGVFESIETDVNQSVTKKREIKKMNPFWKNVKIFTSDPEMTEFFYDGEKLTSLDNELTKKSTDDGKLRRKRSTTVKSNSFMDMIDMDDIVRLLSPNGTIDLNIADEKWILLERKIFFNDVDNDSDEELILNLYFKPKENEDEEMVVDDGLKRSKKMKKALQCPTGTFDCNSDGHLCIPNSLICNGEDNCGNGHDEMLNCAPTLNMFYVKDITLRRHPISNDGNGGWFDLDPATEEMFWLGTRILFILFATSLFLYILLLLCRMCDRLRYPDNQYGSSSAASMFLIPKGNYISISGDTIERKPYQACQPKKSSTGKSSRMDNQGSKIHEYIYVNNNYGQPQGSTIVSTDVQPPTYDNRSRRSGQRGQQQHRRQSSDITTDDEYPPLYEETIRNYGTKK
uniref:Titin-like isoform X2 n=1 Tax=Dermatophagoides pteronyssinus TaxID=6956 RepID=A0A6P6YGQ4_DERPT|nr:titin-like isoform X2 [Dermatophagoides pteronyssinus]